MMTVESLTQKLRELGWREIPSDTLIQFKRRDGLIAWIIMRDDGGLVVSFSHHRKYKPRNNVERECFRCLVGLIVGPR